MLANTDIKKQEENDHRLTTQFETIPKMSTYLLAFAFGEIHYKEAKTKDDVLVRTWSRSDQVDHTQFALDVAIKTLEFYNDYFEIDYPLSKCDMVALPDFSSGAMETGDSLRTAKVACWLMKKTLPFPPSNMSLW